MRGRRYDASGVHASPIWICAGREVKDTLDFIVIGAQKAGTTSLFEYLRRHPQISMPADKEAPYFSHDHAFERGWDAYMAKIALIDPERRWGTVTPHYMIGGVYKRAKASADAAGRYDERTVPLRIRERLPDVRLVAILRDPVARARSHHQMMVMNGSEQRSFDEAIAEHLRPDALERARRRPLADTGYVAWGEYRRILGGYFTVFPREQILVAFTDELERSRSSSWPESTTSSASGLTSSPTTWASSTAPARANAGCRG